MPPDKPKSAQMFLVFFCHLKTYHSSSNHFVRASLIYPTENPSNTLSTAIVMVKTQQKKIKSICMTSPNRRIITKEKKKEEAHEREKK